MKQATFFLAIALLCVSNASAQTNSGGSLSLATEVALPPQPTPVAAAPFDLALPSGVPVAPRETPFKDGLALPSAPAPGEPAEPQMVQGVFQNFDWQAYVGYTYVRFYEVPGTEVNANGVNFGVVYYVKDWLGVDGEFVGGYDWQFGTCGKFLMGMGGVRVRHAMEHNIEVWAHALVGGATFKPQTAYGNQTSIGYEVGGGIDLNTHRRRLAYRLAVDAAGTAYFNTYQISPKVSAGVVFKF
jgi:hypothetical protein